MNLLGSATHFGEHATEAVQALVRLADAAERIADALEAEPAADELEPRWPDPAEPQEVIR